MNTFQRNYIDIYQKLGADVDYLRSQIEDMVADGANRSELATYMLKSISRLIVDMYWMSNHPDGTISKLPKFIPCIKLLIANDGDPRTLDEKLRKALGLLDSVFGQELAAACLAFELIDDPPFEANP